MKIINEIEKSRLNEITGGVDVGENCSVTVPYRSCASLGNNSFEVSECLLKLSCPSNYHVCTGTENYTSCSTPTSTNFVVRS
jgi:hypothetical protein